MKKRVLQVGYRSLNNGGIQAVIMSIVRNLYTDIDFDILLFSNKNGYYDEEFLKYGKIYRIPCDRTGNRLKDILENLTRPLRSFIGTYKILKKGNYDVIHCHNGTESGIILLAARIAGVPIRVTHSHNTASSQKVSEFSQIYKRLVKRLIKRNSTVRIGCSKAANDFLYSKNDNKAIIINNAIDLNEFNPSNYSRDKKDKSIIKFIHVGRYCYQKNQSFLIDVFKEIHNKNHNTELNLVGFGEEQEIIKKEIMQSGLSKSVKMLPHDSNLPKLLAQSDYFIFPSNYEGLGIVLIEAQAMQVKCFASSAVPPEANLGLCTYYPLDIGSKAWAYNILEYISKNHGKTYKASNSLLSSYNIKKIALQYKDIYERLEP